MFDSQFASDSVIDLTSNQTFDIDLGYIDTSDITQSVDVRVGDVTYSGFPVNPDLFPLRTMNAEYNAHLLYTTTGIELRVIKNGGSSIEENDGVARMEVENLSKQKGDLAVLYLIGVLENAKDLS